MDWGIRNWNPDNNGLILDTKNENFARVFDTTYLNGSAGSLTDSRFSAGEPFAARITTGDYLSTTKPIQLSFSGNTLNWTSGPATWIMYGIGAGVSSYNPAMNGNTPGFICRSADGSVVTLDQSMFGLHLIAKGVKNLNSSQNPTITIDTPDGKAPLIAVRSTSHCYVKEVSVSGTKANITLGPYASIDVEWFAFGKIYASLSKGIGAKWYDSSGSTLMGDTSVPMLKPISMNIRHFMYPFNNTTTWVAPDSSRKTAVIMNDPGFGIYKPSVTMGQGSIQGYRAGAKVFSNNSVEIADVTTFSVQAGGTNTILDYNDAYFSIIDVTNF